MKAEVEARLSHEARGPSMGTRLQEEDVESGINGVLPRMRSLPHEHCPHENESDAISLLLVLR